MDLKLRIGNETEYNRALQRAASLMNAKSSTGEMAELEELASAIEEFESEHVSIGEPTRAGLKQHLREARTLK